MCSPFSRVEKNPTFFLRPVHWIFGCNAKNPISANKIMVLLQHLALGNRHHHGQTFGPLPYNLNLFAVKTNKIEFCWTPNDWGFKKRKQL